MKAYGEVDVQIHIFLISALAGGEWSASRPGRITPGERDLCTHWIGGWVDPRSGLDDVEKRKFNIKVSLKGIGWADVGRIRFCQYRDQPRVEGLLWRRKRTFGFRKMLGMS
jgi:hypothetical protein